MIQNNLKKNRGKVILRIGFITDNPTEEYLLLIFSNFFPIGMEYSTVYSINDTVKMYGYSKHFREINEGEPIPEYEIFFIINDGKVEFDKVIEIVI